MAIRPIRRLLLFRRILLREALASQLCFSLLFSAGLAQALDPNKRLTQYMHTSWRLQDASAPSGMGSIAQTSDGYLWLSSYSGDLYRFDGVRFSPPVVPVKDASIPKAVRIFADHSGALWVLGRRETVRVKDGVVSRFKLQGLGAPQSFSPESDGSMWVLNDTQDAPLCHISGQTTKCFGKSEGVPIAPLNSVLSDGKGGLWLGGQTSLVHWHAGVSEVYPVPALKSNVGQEGIVGLIFAPDGSLWVGITEAGPGLGLGHLVDGAIKPFVTPTFNGNEVSVNSMMFDRDANFWVATDSKGLFRIHGNVVEHYGHSDGLSDDNVDAVFEDREGIVWAATSSGLDSFRDPHVTTFSPLQGVGKGGASRRVLASKDGTVWVGGFDSLDHIVNGAVSSLRTGHGLPGHQVTALLEDRGGDMWVGIDNELFVFKNGLFRRVPGSDHRPLGLVRAITEDREGNIWAECVGKLRKLVRIHDFAVSEEFSTSQIPYGINLAPDPGGGIWIGTQKGDIVLVRNGVVAAQFALNPGGDPITGQIVAQRDGSVLAGSENGLVGWRNGQVQRMTRKNGLPCDKIVSFIEDKEERWWLYTDCGVVAVADSELQRWWTNPAAVVHNRVYDVLDGAQPPIYAFGNAAACSSDGRVWFASGIVVEMIDPSRMAEKALPATATIQRLIADRKEFEATNGLKLSPHPRDLQIDYTSPTYLIPQKVKFRYRLEHYDRDWTEAGMRRQAFYTDLPAGQYSFRVVACNSDGVWNNDGARLDFQIEPAYYETKWFRVLCGVLLAAILWAAYQLRVRQLHQQFALTLEARVAERTRIARELHDTLLQSAHGLLLRFETVSQLLNERPAEAKQQLESAIKQTAEFVTQARDEVQGLRGSTTESNDLATEISSLGEALASDSVKERQTAFQVAVEGEARNLHPIVRDEIYKICAEALRNAFQHAEAGRVEVELRYDHDEFRLRVRDDGRGIDPKILSRQGSEGHYGLRGMRERATLIGGSLSVWSKVDAGAEVELRVPGAYAKAAERRWWLPRWTNV